MATLSIKVCAGQVIISGAEGWQKAVLMLDPVGNMLRATLTDGKPVDEEDVDDYEELESGGCFVMDAS